MHPVLLRVGDTAIGAYGALVALGYLVGTLWLWSQRERMGLTFRQFWLLCYCIIAGAALGAKAGYVLVEWPRLSASPWETLVDGRSGWVFWSGFLGTMAAGLLCQKAFNAFCANKMSYLRTADYFGAALPLGHAIGRLGCFAEGCCHGLPTAMPWGAVFTSPASSVAPGLLGVPLHPVQLYEAAGELAISLSVMLWVLPRIRAGSLRRGTAFLGYIALYSVLRLATEPFRGDDRGVFLSPALSPSQWWSAAGLAIAAAALYCFPKPEKRS